jgi:DNA repair exonuclease SbcCD nuclease subunit
MKINLPNEFIIISDLHFGERKNSKEYFQQQLDFFIKQLLPYMEKNSLCFILCLGDFFHDRKQLNIEIKERLEKELFSEMQNKKIEFYTLLGNHDIYYKNSLEINSLKSFERKFDRFKVIEEPTYDESKENLFVPWITPSNFLEWKDIIKNTNCKNIFGHFEIGGFIFHDEINSGNMFTNKMFPKDCRVISGHYHDPQKKGNVHYVGSTFYQNWSSKNQTRGFYHWKDNKMKFIENKHSIKFIQINFSKDEINNYKQFKNNWVRIFATQNEMNGFKFIEMKNKIDREHPYNLEIIQYDDSEFLTHDEQHNLDDISNIFDFENISETYLSKAILPPDIKRNELQNLFKTIIQYSKEGNNA